jgi:hypothetical protein
MWLVSWRQLIELSCSRMVCLRTSQVICTALSFGRRLCSLLYWATIAVGHIHSPRCPLLFFLKIILRGVPSVSLFSDLDHSTGKTVSGNCGLKVLVRSSLRRWTTGQWRKLLNPIIPPYPYVARLRHLAPSFVSYQLLQAKLRRRWTIKYRAEACALAMKRAQILEATSYADKKAFQWRKKFCHEVRS